MAEKKNKAVAKSKKAAGTTKKAKKSSKSNIRVQRIDNKVNLKNGVKALKSSRFNVSVRATDVVTRFGVIANMDSTSVNLLTKPKSGSSKEGFMLLDRADIIAVEGAVGESSKVLVHEQSEVALYKDVAVSIKDGAYILKEADGSEIHIQKRPGLSVSAIAFA